MPKKGGVMTPAEIAFSAVFADTRSAQYAAREAGFSAPHSSGYKALQRPAVQAEIARIYTERMFNELLPLAVDAHIDLLTNKSTPAGARVQAVKLVYDKTIGGDAPGGANSKEPHEMTADELANQLIKLRREASERATPVIDVVPSTPGVFD